MVQDYKQFGVNCKIRLTRLCICGGLPGVYQVISGGFLLSSIVFFVRYLTAWYNMVKFKFRLLQALWKLSK